MRDWQEQPAQSKRPELRVIEPRLPYDGSIEAVVLATLMDHPSRLDAVIDVLRPDDFYMNRHRILYGTMLDYYRKHGRGADFLMLSNMLEEHEAVKPSDLADMLHQRHELFSFDFGAGVRALLGMSTQRRTIFASQELATIGYTISDPDEARAAVEKVLYELTMQSAERSDFEALSDTLPDSMHDIEYASQHRGEVTGVPTGYGDLNLMTSGFQRSDLILLGGRPGDGKTSFGLNIGYNAAKRGFMVAVFSLEMSKKQLNNRLLSLVSRVPSNQLRTGWLDEDEMKRVVDACDTLAELPIYIDDTAGSPITSIRGKLRRLSAKVHRKPDLVIVDYLGLMTPDHESKSAHENRNQEISQISRGLKSVAREFDVPVLALAQLNRAVELRKEKKPQLSDLRDSGSLEQDADIVLFLSHSEEEKNVAYVTVAKQRNGPTGEFTLSFNRALTRFDEIDPTMKEEEYA